MALADQHDETRCPECDGAIERGDHEAVCTGCGLVVDEHRIDQGPDWRSYDDGEDNSRVGSPESVMYHDGGLSTEIGRYRDGAGKTLSGEKRQHLYRLRKQHRRSRYRSRVESNRAHANGEIRRMATALGFEKGHVEQGCLLFKQAHEANLVLGHSLEAMAAASVYAIVRMERAPIVLGDVEDVARVDEGRITVAYKTIDRELGIPAPPPHPKQYIGRLCSDLDLGADVRARAETLAELYEQHYEGRGRSPNGVAGGAVYIAAKEHDSRRTQSEIADEADCTEMTVRQRKHDIVELLEGVQGE